MQVVGLLFCLVFKNINIKAFVKKSSICIFYICCPCCQLFNAWTWFVTFSSGNLIFCAMENGNNFTFSFFFWKWDCQSPAALGQETYSLRIHFLCHAILPLYFTKQNYKEWGHYYLLFYKQSAIHCTSVVLYLLSKCFKKSSTNCPVTTTVW